ncbi:hypothetical protein V5799_015525 [Amblyomma americanum]|uniref:Uncharacterized protein n=1 Tax=Amblyomma americanum TaxID=6943 RepID=A0AAQ4F8S5_AMBAM
MVDSRSQQIAHGSTVTADLFSAAAPSGRGGFQVAADCLRATSPALRFHGDGGPFLRSCPPLAVVDSRSRQVAYGSTVEVDFYSAASPSRSGRGGFEVGAGRLRATSPALRFHGDSGCFFPQLPPLTVVDLRSEQVAYGPLHQP